MAPSGVHLGTADGGECHGIDPETYLRNVLPRIADHQINHIDELLPWKLAADHRIEHAA